MGMTIDDSVRLLEDYLEWLKLHKMDGTGVDEATRNLIDVAKKYQKIQEIYSDWNDGHFSDAVFCLRVKAVLNGNDD